MREQIEIEKKRIIDSLPGADENKLKTLDGLIEQAAFERVYLKVLNEKALTTGLVEFHPENAKLQRSLPVSTEIARHSAALTNILDKLCKHLSVAGEDDDDALAEYE